MGAGLALRALARRPFLARQRQRGPQLAHPQFRGAAPPAGESLQGGQFAFGARQLFGDQGQHVVGQDGHGGDVALAGHPVPRQPQFTARHQLLRPLQLADAAHRPPFLAVVRGVRPGGVGQTNRLGFLAQPVDPVEFCEGGAQGVGKLHQKFHVQSGVVEPIGGQRPRRPILATVALGQGHAEELLGHGREVDLGQAEEAAGYLGVHQVAGVQPEVGQTGEVGHRGVDDPVEGVEGVGQARLRDGAGHRLGVDEDRAGALAAQLHQERAVVVAVGGGPFGVDGQRAAARGQKSSRIGDLVGGDQDVGGSAAGREQGCAHEDELNPAGECAPRDARGIGRGEVIGDTRNWIRLGQPLLC